MERFNLERSGLPGLSFEGDLIASEGTRPDISPPARWYVFDLYELDQDTFVLHIQYRTENGREQDRSETLVGSPDQIVDDAIQYDWMQHVQDFPQQEKWDARREDRRFKIVNYTEASLSRLWAAAEVTEEL
tara:strand:+ start:1862 stop:2254 length:393 start_codon:yes stop_codon:yes gene_type:complete